MDKPNSQEGWINYLRTRGRTVTGWWDGEPIHRPMTQDEMLANAKIPQPLADFALLLLGNKDFKPKYD